MIWVKVNTILADFVMCEKCSMYIGRKSIGIGCKMGWRLEFVGNLSDERFENVPVKWIEHENYWDCG